jgi:hypothetical protein
MTKGEHERGKVHDRVIGPGRAEGAAAVGSYKLSLSTRGQEREPGHDPRPP